MTAAPITVVRGPDLGLPLDLRPPVTFTPGRLRQLYIDRGWLRPRSAPDVPTETKSEAPLLRIDERGRARAAKRIERPEPEYIARLSGLEWGE